MQNWSVYAGESSSLLPLIRGEVFFYHHAFFKLTEIFFNLVKMLFILWHHTSKSYPNWAFWYTLLFREVLGSQPNWEEGKEISHIALPHICIAFPIINILHQNGTFVIIAEPTQTYHYYPKSISYIRVHFWCYIFYGFW